MAEASLRGGGTGVELLLFSARLGVGTGRHWRWGGRCLLGSGHGATGWREMWATELFGYLQRGGDSSLT